MRAGTAVEGEEARGAQRSGCWLERQQSLSERERKGERRESERGERERERERRESDSKVERAVGAEERGKGWPDPFLTVGFLMTSPFDHVAFQRKKPITQFDALSATPCFVVALHAPSPALRPSSLAPRPSPHSSPLLALVHPIPCPRSILSSFSLCGRLAQDRDRLLTPCRRIPGYDGERDLLQTRQRTEARSHTRNTRTHMHTRTHDLRWKTPIVSFNPGCAHSNNRTHLCGAARALCAATIIAGKWTAACRTRRGEITAAAPSAGRATSGSPSRP